MENISLETLQNFCRTCLKELKRQKCNIHCLHLQVRHWLQDATVHNPLSNDTYPNSICHSCRNKLEDLLEFRQMCASSRRKISEILKSKEPKEQISNHSKENTTREEVNGLGVEQHFLTIAVVARQDPEGIKSELNKDLEVEEPIISSLNPIDDKNEPDSFKYFKPDDEEEKYDGSSDEYLCQSGEESSDSEIDISKEENDCNPLDGSCIREDIEKNTVSKTNKPTTKRKKYTYTFRCDQCKYRCVSQQTLDIHMRTHLGLKPYQCPKCDISFDKSTPMLKHLNEVHGERELNIICELEDCGKKFTSTRSYKDHYRQNHIKKDTSEKQDKLLIKTPYRHVCEECGKTYTKLQTFKEHQYTHGPKEHYPFQCTECDKAFVKQRTFKEHQLRHAGIRNFECTYCGAKRTTKKELRTHINSHTREKKYPCPNCPMIFYRTTNLRVHVEVVHKGIRRFACRYCNQTFGKGDNLKHHELLHTGEKPHECTECGKRFVQKVSLRSHMKTHNK